VKYRSGIEHLFSLCLIAAFLVMAAALPAFAQEQDESAAESASENGASEAIQEPALAEPAPEGDEEGGDGLVAINLNKVNVEQLVKFLSEVTGKNVVKHKDVKAEITVMSPEKVSRKRAFSLICEALLLEKVAVVEGKDSVTLVPVDMLSEVVVELLPGETDDITAGITRTVMRIKFADVEEIDKLIKPLLSKNGTSLAHPASKNIIVTDTASRVANIESVVGLLDVLEADDRQVKIFTLKHADAEAIAPILKTVLGILAEKANGQQAGGQQQPGQPPQPQQKGQPGPAPGTGILDVVSYKDANWLVIVAPKEILVAAQPLVDELDRERPQELTLRLIPIRYANPSEVASQLTPLFNKRPEKKVKDTVEITAHERSSSLVILSSEENYKVIGEIVAQLDTEESVQMMTKTYELKHADAEDIAKQMNNLYSGLEQNRRSSYFGGWYGSSRQEEDKTRFVPERRTNSVIAIARPTEFTKIDGLIEKLDKPIDVDEVAPRIFRIRYVDAQEMTDVLNEIFGGKDESKSGGYWDY